MADVFTTIVAITPKPTTLPNDKPFSPAIGITGENGKYTDIQDNKTHTPGTNPPPR